jgi:hypothetical protein
MRVFNKYLALTAAIVAFSFIGVNAQSFSGNNTRSARSIE